MSGKKYSRKKISRVARERFTATNLLYTQIFIDYLSSKDARKIKFFDEAGIKTPDIGGVEYYNLIDGASNTIEFLNFFSEAGNAVNFETRRPALDVGDIIVMDNLGVHHYGGGEALEEFLADMGIELIYTPAYSPDLIP